MDLLKALDILSSISIDKQPNEDETESRKLKITACKVVVDQLTIPSLRNSADFPRFLSVGSASLVRMHGDEDINVRAAAEECLNKIIYEFMVSHPERILFELYKIVKKGKASGRAQKSALLKFAEISHYIKPAKCRKYITSLLVPIADIINDGIDLMHEALSTAMEKISSNLLLYLKDKEIHHLIQLLLNNMGNSNATIRRASASSVVAICKYSPYIPVSSFDFVIQALLKNFNSQNSQDSEMKVPLENIKIDINSSNVNLLIGSLNCFLQLIRLSREYLTNKKDSIVDLAVTYIPAFGNLILPCLTYEDHNLVGGALELLHEIFRGSSYGKLPSVWGNPTETSKKIHQFSEILIKLSTENSVRTSNKAVALNILSEISRNYPIIIIECLSTKQIKLIDFIYLMKNHNDPLIRGNSAILLGYFICGYVDHVTTELSSVNVNELISLLTTMSDESNISVRFICKALGKSLKALRSSKADQIVDSFRWSLKIIMRLLTITKNDTYWLVVVETLQSLTKADFKLLHILENIVESTSVNKSRSVDDSNVVEKVSTIQKNVLNFILIELGDNDPRVRNSAASAICTLVKKLYFDVMIDHANSGLMHSFVLEKNVVSVYYESNMIQSNLSHIVMLLLKKLQNVHVVNDMKGCITALHLLSKSFGAKEDNPFANIISTHSGDMVCIILDLVTSCVWLATDLDAHISALQIIGYISKYSGRNFTKYWQPTLKHLLQVINVLTLVYQSKPFPLKEKFELTSSMPLGTVTNEVLYNKLYDRLVATRNAHISAFTSEDKFSQIRYTCLETLSNVIQCTGKDIVPYCEEITGYLTAHFPQESSPIIRCVKELFICVFDTPNENISPPSSPMGNNVFSQSPLRDSRRSQNQAYVDDLFVHNELFFSAKAFPAIEMKDYVRSASSNKNRNMLRLFEPLVVKSLQYYQITHDTHSQYSVLSMMGQLVRFGVDFSRLDKDSHFISYLISQLLEKNSYLKSPTLIMPAIYEFLAMLTFVRPHIIEILNLQQLMEMIEYGFTNSTFNSGIIVGSLKKFFLFMFATSKEDETKFNSANSADLAKIKIDLFRKLMDKICFPQAAEVLGIILSQLRHAKDAMIELDWKQYSQEIGNKLFQVLGSPKERLFITSADVSFQEFLFLNK